MKAVICTKYGPPEVLKIQEVARPTPKEKEILVKIMATAVNSGDVRVRSLAVEGWMKWMMRMVLGFSKPRKSILGTVFSGVVEGAGNKVSEFNPGDKVFGMTGFNFGSYAQYIAVHQNSNVMKMPQNATYEEAAAIIFGAQTAIYFLEKAKIAQQANPKVLIIGATGSVGVAAIQVCKHYGAQISVVCSSEGSHLMKELGVSDIILYDKADFTSHTGRFDMVFDAVGKTTKKQCKKLLLNGGVYKTVGGTEYASESKKQLALIKELFENGKLNAVIDKTFSMDNIVDAHRYVDKGRKKGNVVVRISP
ncbi:NAD(P)-dependent alcohol dehydrogenase [Rhodocytophaga aerolata]|uniref:NAD(P)-dependent alcohol dehydrogenase n=1 Tax=Rhodocytophaga aerolata TaxID=455078 RepID=A0ABT8RGY9_9BACT|nr:NAD(P)-dependent alcohol dehydrogenase [Rhodocytophaga aerolata]MDO1451368.1 NAD(P)-dependent alcohol dehydrogenase [Rhodocytophaga aerolata]